MSSRLNNMEGSAGRLSWCIPTANGGWIPIPAHLADELPVGARLFNVTASTENRLSHPPAENPTAVPQIRHIAPRSHLPANTKGNAAIVRQGYSPRSDGSEEYLSLSEMLSEGDSDPETNRQMGTLDYHQELQEVQQLGSSSRGETLSAYPPRAHDVPRPFPRQILRSPPRQIPARSLPVISQASHSEHATVQATKTIYTTATVNSKLTPTTTARPLPPSGIEPDESKKRYCAYWMRHGECDFEQQGCKFKHEMPEDRATLNRLGFRTVPKWYLERKQGRTWIGSGAPSSSHGEKNARAEPKKSPTANERKAAPVTRQGGKPQAAGNVVKTPSVLPTAIRAPPAVSASKHNVSKSLSQPGPKIAPRKSPGEWFQGAALVKTPAPSVASMMSPASNAVSNAKREQTKPLPAKSLQEDDLIDFDFPILMPERVAASPTKHKNTANVSSLTAPSFTSHNIPTPTSTPTTTTPPKPLHPVHFTTKPSHPSPQRLEIELRHAQMAKDGAARINAAARAISMLKEKTDERATQKTIFEGPSGSGRDARVDAVADAAERVGKMSQLGHEQDHAAIASITATKAPTPLTAPTNPHTRNPKAIVASPPNPNFNPNRKPIAQTIPIIRGRGGHKPVILSSTSPLSLSPSSSSASASSSSPTAQGVWRRGRRRGGRKGGRGGGGGGNGVGGAGVVNGDVEGKGKGKVKVGGLEVVEE